MSSLLCVVCIPESGALVVVGGYNRRRESARGRSPNACLVCYRWDGLF
jgi:hypothetical protein